MGKVKVARISEAELTQIGGEVPTNGAESSIEHPYRAEVTIEGVAPLLFHRYNCEGVEEKAKAAKGSKAKKSDAIETYVYRNASNEVCLPGEYLRQACVNVGRSMQDPRSPRKSARDLFNATIISLTDLASLGVQTWDYEDKRRVVVQRNAITRVRPAMNPGWAASFVFMITLPEYVAPSKLNEIIAQAGRLVGIGDFRPTYGRFVVTHFGRLKD